jgi:hypothetical protein
MSLFTAKNQKPGAPSTNKASKEPLSTPHWHSALILGHSKTKQLELACPETYSSLPMVQAEESR